MRDKAEQLVNDIQREIMGIGSFTPQQRRNIYNLIIQSPGGDVRVKSYRGYDATDEIELWSIF